MYRVSQKKVYRDPGLDSKPITSLSTESNQSQSSIHVNIMVPGVTVTVNFFLGHPVHKEGPNLDKVSLFFPGLDT